MAVDLTDQIEAAASAPKTVEVDGQKVDAQSLGDLVKADAYLAQKEAAGRKRGGIIFAKLVQRDES